MLTQAVVESAAGRTWWRFRNGRYDRVPADRSLEEIVAWAAEHAASRPWRCAGPTWATGPSPPPTSRSSGSARPRLATSRSCSPADLELSVALAFYDNNLHPDPAERKAINDHVLACVDAAYARLGCPTVGTFMSRDPWRWPCSSRRPRRSSSPWSTGPAGRAKLIIENCVMEGWHPDGYPGNLAYSPELWEWMFSQELYLNCDPSHLVWMRIDPVTALRPYVDRIPHAQAKDIRLFADRRNRYGWPGKAVARPDPWDVGWWRYRVPGLGEVDWRGGRARLV